MFDANTDPGDIPAELLDRPRVLTHLHVERVTGWDAVAIVAELHPELADEIAAGRRRWDSLDAPDASGWYRDLLTRLGRDRGESEGESGDTVRHDCVCGREEDVPFAPGTRGVLTCDACGRRCGVTAFDGGSGLIWALDR